MSVNKKNRSLWGSRSEAQRIYYQRQTIKRLEKENNQLKEQLKGVREEREYLFNKLSIENNNLQQENNQLKEQRQELRSWLEGWIENEEYCYLATTPKDRCRKDVYQDVLSKLNELEGGKND